jgi:hypothetical protein
MFRVTSSSFSVRFHRVLCASYLKDFHSTHFVAPEPEGSSPHSQQLATGPYPDPLESIPHPTSQSPQGPFWFHPPIYASVCRVISLLRAFLPKPCTLFYLSHACHMPRPPHSPWLDGSNYIWRWVQINETPQFADSSILLLLHPP